MKVKDLKRILDSVDENLEVIATMCSDYTLVDEFWFSVVEAVDKGFYVMRPHETMSEENKAAVKQYFHIDGN